MNLVKAFQDISSPFLTIISEIFSFLGSLTMLTIILAIVFLLVNKIQAFKLGLGLSINFVFGGLILKNIFARPRPYLVDSSIFAERTYLSFGSLPSVSAMNSAGFCVYFMHKSKNTKKLKWGILSLSILFLAFLSFSKIYFAENYLLDMILGLMLGIIIFMVIFKFARVKEQDYKWYLFGLIVPLVLIFVYINEWTLTTGHIRIFEYSGFIASFLLFSFLEQKFIRYEVKNNLIFSSFKVFMILIILGIYFLVFELFVPKLMILCFLEFFFAGLIIFMILPLIFKKCEKYFYVFSNDVSFEHVTNSFISTSLKSTNKIAKSIAKDLKPGDIVVLKGDLGAGKTVLVRDILQSLDVKDKITSPTFTILNEYKSNLGHFYHFDMYRVENEFEAENIGLSEIIEDKNSIKFIEWAENVPRYLPPHYKKITITKLGKKSRNIILEEI